MSESYREQCLRHKYASIPDEPSPHKKKIKKKAPKRADHKHDYRNVLVYAKGVFNESEPYLASRCSICGKVSDYKPDELADRFGVNAYFFGAVKYAVKDGNIDAFLVEASNTYDVYHTDERLIDVKYL